MLRRIAVPLALLLVAVSAWAQPASRLVIPAAGSVPGANGTHFRSDITVANLGTTAQRVNFYWLPRDVAGSRTPVRTVTLEVGGTIYSDDFVREILQQNGLGAIVIEAVDAQGQADERGLLHATSRIWTPQPGSSGTTSQSLPARALNTIAHEHATIVGLRSGNQYRLNYGIVNLDFQTEWTFRVRVVGTIATFAPVEYTVSVKPYSMVQLPVDWPEDPHVRIDVEALRAPDGLLTLWLPYASNVDNVTGDAWSTLGVEQPAR